MDLVGRSDLLLALSNQLSCVFMLSRSVRICLFVTFAIFASACEGVNPSPNESPAGAPWTVVDASINLEDGFKVLLYHDMEGLSGQDNADSFRASEPEYSDYGRDLLVSDVNAVAAGLFEGGATEVHIVDGHGSGNRAPDLDYDQLDPRVQPVSREEAFDAYTGLVDGSDYDAVGVVGMHAKTGSEGFASHTYTLGIGLELNGQSITETEFVALSWGRADVPVIFASGDDRLESDLATMPWIKYARVKNATSASTVELIPVDEARATLTSQARVAAEQATEAKVLSLNLPVRGTVRVAPPANLSIMENVPGIDYENNGVSFTAHSLMEFYDGARALIGIARTAYPNVLFENLRAREDASEIFGAYRDALFDRWLDTESGRYEAPVPGAPAGDERPHHGYN